MKTEVPRQIGFIGTGIMGGHMARRLAEAGFGVTAWNRTAAKAEDLAAVGRHCGANGSRRGARRGRCDLHAQFRSRLRRGAVRKPGCGGRGPSHGTRARPLW